MKQYKFFSYCLLSCLVLLLAACKDDDEEAGNQTCFSESGLVAIPLSYQDDETLYKVTVLNRDMGTSTVQITSSTQEELDAYNQQYKTSYSLLPKEVYELANTVDFTSGERSKVVEMTIHTGKLFEMIRDDVRKNISKEYALPLKLSSNLNGSSGVIYFMNMSYPEMQLAEKEAKITLNESQNELLLNAYTYMNGELMNNDQNVSVDMLVAENAEEWLREYNSKSKIQYQLLPSDVYKLGKLTGEADAGSCSVSLEINRTHESGVAFSGGNYILPLVCGDSEGLAIKSDTCVVKVANPRSYTSVDCDRSEWRVIYCNSDQKLVDNDGAPEYILDGNPGSFWSSCFRDDWNFGPSFDNFDYERFEQDGYMQCKGKHELPVSLVVDMKRDYFISQIGLQQRSQTQYAHTKNAKVYISNDDAFKLTTMRNGGTKDGYYSVNENNWQLIATCTMTRSGEVFWTSVPAEEMNAELSKGRFLKFVALDQLDDDSDQSNMFAGLGELLAKEVITVDGVPVR